MMGTLVVLMNFTYLMSGTWVKGWIHWTPGCSRSATGTRMAPYRCRSPGQCHWWINTDLRLGTHRLLAGFRSIWTYWLRGRRWDWIWVGLFQSTQRRSSLARSQSLWFMRWGWVILRRGRVGSSWMPPACSGQMAWFGTLSSIFQTPALLFALWVSSPSWVPAAFLMQPLWPFAVWVPAISPSIWLRICCWSPH